jgi:hypothetical protein
MIVISPRQLFLLHRRAFTGATLAILFLIFAAAPSQAGSEGQLCVRQKVGGMPPCTANDVRIGNLEVISGPDSCVLGEDITATLKATIESGPDRYDIGIWVNETGGSAKDDLGGTCYRDYLPPPLARMSCDQDGGPYFNGESGILTDTCGDVYAQNTDPCSNADIAVRIDADIQHDRTATHLAVFYIALLRQ